MTEVKNSLFSAAMVESVTEGQYIGHTPSEISVTNVQVDSRKCGADSLFVPLPGDNTDGHLFLKQAIDKGSTLCFVDRRYYEKHELVIHELEKSDHPIGLIIVADTLRALQDLARSYLDLHRDTLYVAITGSNGKTTTKELVGSMLSAWKPTAVSPGNLNSDIGLPLAAFGVSSEDEIAVFEMGMNRRGEISDLADIVQPKFGAITNVGTAHIGLLGSKQAIAKEKKAIFSTMDNTCTAIILEHDDYRAFLSDGLAAKVVTFGPQTTSGYEGRRDLGLEGSVLMLNGHDIAFPLIGEHNILNALCAITMAQEVGCPEEYIIQGLEKAHPLFGRNEIIGGPVTVIRDCYNANAESTEKAIEFMDALSWTGRKILVTGSMKELGERAQETHEAIASRAAASHADLIFLFGDEFALVSAADSRITKTTDFDVLTSRVMEQIQEGDLVLVKGSRSLGLERLADLIVSGSAEVQKC